MKRLFGCTVSLIYQDERGETAVNSVVARRTEFWWNERKPDELSLWESKIELGEDLFNEIISHPVPLNMNTLTALKQLWCMNSQSHLETRPDHACGPLTEKGSADSSFLVSL